MIEQTCRLRKATTPPYRVRIAPTPTVIDQQGRAVSDALVLEIHFPGDVAETPAGRGPVVTAPGVARILVGAITVRGVPLC